VIRRVLLLHEFTGGFGGAERYLELLNAGLGERGVEVAALVFVWRDGDAGRLAARLQAGGAAVTVVEARSRPGPIRAAVRRHAPDVLHWNFVDPHAFQGALWLLPSWAAPSVVTEHLPMLRAGVHRRLTRGLANRRIARLIAVGDSAATAVRAAWRRPPRITVVPNGVPVVPAALRRPTLPAHEPARLVFVGRLTEQKGVLDLPEVVAALAAAGTPARLTLVGDGPQRAELEARAASRAPGMIEIAGFADDPTPALAAADIFVAPSRWEGAPLAAREALAAGVPVVLSDIPPNRDLLDSDGEGAVRLAPIGDAAAWAAAVQEGLRALPASGAAALRAAERSSSSRMVEETLAVYEAVASGAREER
jgi:glycosyltransferase involved in cell wall biosynthesis